MAYSRKKWAVARRKNAALMRMIMEKAANYRGDSTCSSVSTVAVVVDLEAEHKRTKDAERKRAINWVKRIKSWKTSKRVVTQNGESFTVTASLGANAKTMVIQKLYFRGPVPRIRNKKPYWRSIRRSNRVGKWRVYYLESHMNRNTWSVQWIPVWDDKQPQKGYLRTRWCARGDAWTARWGKSLK